MNSSQSCLFASMIETVVSSFRLRISLREHFPQTKGSHDSIFPGPGAPISEYTPQTKRSFREALSLRNVLPWGSV